MRVDLWVGKIPWRRKWQPSPAFLPGESHGQRGLWGYNLWGPKELVVTKHTCRHVHPGLYKSQNMETTYMPIHMGMDKEDVVHTKEY